jgi:hypothetical protein
MGACLSNSPSSSQAQKDEDGDFEDEGGSAYEKRGLLIVREK